jgi:hypothetical protein
LINDAGSILTAKGAIVSEVLRRVRSAPIVSIGAIQNQIADDYTYNRKRRLNTAAPVRLDFAGRRA